MKVIQRTNKERHSINPWRSID